MTEWGVRPMTEADIEAAAAVQVDTFGGELAKAIEHFRVGPRYTWRDGWVVGEPDEIRALAIAIPARWWFRGCAYSVSAIASVAVRAVDRRRGLASAVMRGLLQAQHHAGVPASLLYPFQHGFYRRLGYATVGLGHYWRIPTGQLSCDAAERDGVRTMRADDRAAIQHLHAGYLNRVGGFERSAAQWQRRWASDDERWVVLQRGQHLLGYLAYRVAGRAIELRELIADEPRAARGLWDFLAAQVEQRDEIRYHAPLHEPLWATLREPLMFEAANRGFVVSDAAALTVSCMARLVDLASALRQRAFAADVAGRITLEVRDPVFAPAGERVLLTLEGGRATVEPTGEAPDARCDVVCASQLFCGALTASQARWYGLLDANDAAVALLERAFPFGPPFLQPADWF